MQSNKYTLQRILFVSGVLSLIIIYVLSWVDVITDPSQRTGSDFIAFYAAGRSILERGPAAAYDLDSLKANEEAVLGFQIADSDVNPFVHPPFILPLLWFLAHFDYITAFYLWIAVMLVFAVLCAQLALKFVPEATGLNKLILWTGILLFFPLYISLVNGQDSVLLLLGCMIWYYGITQDSGRVAGLGLALTTIRPQIALVLAIPFFFNRSYRKVWWWFCLGGIFLVMVSIFLIGWDGVQNFFHILSISAGGEGYKINEIAMVNLIGLVKHLIPGVDATVIRTIGWTAALIGLTSLCILWRRLRSLEEKYVALAVILSMFTAAHLHYHDLVLLIIPMIVLIRKSIVAAKDLSIFIILTPFAVSLVFLLSYSVSQVTLPTVFIVEVLLLLSLWWIDRQNERTSSLLGDKKIGEQ